MRQCVCCFPVGTHPHQRDVTLRHVSPMHRIQMWKHFRGLENTVVETTRVEQRITPQYACDSPVRCSAQLRLKS